MRLWWAMMAGAMLGPVGAEENAASAADASGERQMLVVSEPEPWLGLEVAPLESKMRAHAPGVPDRVGFMVESVVKDGPAEAAGLKPFDILWKFDDQLLVNEAQLAILIDLREPGESVRLAIVRSGEQITLELVFGRRPPRLEVAGVRPVDLPLMPHGIPGMPQVRVTPQERVAELTRADGGFARLYFKGEEPQVVLTNPDGETVYRGPVTGDDGLLVPDEWRPSVGAMFRSLNKARETSWTTRRPRPRVVLPSEP